MCSLNDEDAAKVLDRHLGKDPNRRISSFSVAAKSDENIGYLGNHWSLTIDYFDQRGGIRRRKFFVKSHKLDGAENSFLGKCGIFQREVDFYRVLVEEVRETVGEPVWCPKFCHSKTGILVLEDLSEKGFGMANGGVNLDGAHVEAALKALARFHASFLLLEKAKSISLASEHPHLFREILYDRNQPDSPSSKWISWQTEDLLVGIQLLKKYSETEKEFVREKFVEEIMRIYTLNERSYKYRQVLTHGDIWKNNLLFRYSAGVPDDCRLVDFQFFRYAPPAHDVMHFLHFATSKSLREEKENAFLRFYYDCLSREFQGKGRRVKEELTWDQFFESCAIYKELAVIQSLLSMHYILGQASLAVESENYQKHEEYLSRHRKNYVRDFFGKEKYTEKVEELLYELIDNYIMRK